MVKVELLRCSHCKTLHHKIKKQRYEVDICVRMPLYFLLTISKPRTNPAWVFLGLAS